MKEYMYVLKKIPLFKGMSPPEIESMLLCMGSRIASFQRNSYIFSAGNPATSVGILLEGTASVVRDDSFGNRTILQNAAQGTMFGEAFACSRVEILPVSVVALSDCRVLLLDYKRVLTTCSTACSFHHKIIENMLGILAQKILSLNEKIDALSAKTTREKLMVYLLSCAEKANSRSFTISFNRQQLADYLCVERSAMSAELSRMQKDGIIAFHKNLFELL